MSSHSVKREEQTKKDMTWRDLISHSEEQIRAMTGRIKQLSKSIVFFKKQIYCGIPFPISEGDRHKELS